jgi:hypothetical protein
MKVKGVLGLGAGLALKPAGTWLGLAKPKLDVEARCVRAVQGECVESHIGTKEHGSSVSLGVHHQHHEQIALALDLVDDRLRQHDLHVLGRVGFISREVTPVHLAVISFRASRPRTSGASVEVAQLRVSTQIPDLLQPESPDAIKKLLFAVIAVGDHGTARRQRLLPDYTRQVVSRESNAAGLLRSPLAGGRCLLHPEAIGTVAGEIEPGQGRDVHAFVRAAMTAVPETSEALRRLPTCGAKTGIQHQGLCVGGGDPLRDGGFMERDDKRPSRTSARRSFPDSN